MSAADVVRLVDEQGMTGAGAARVLGVSRQTVSLAYDKATNGEPLRRPCPVCRGRLINRTSAACFRCEQAAASARIADRRREKLEIRRQWAAEMRAARQKAGLTLQRMAEYFDCGTRYVWGLESGLKSITPARRSLWLLRCSIDPAAVAARINGGDWGEDPFGPAEE